jgi:hypothetical protein
MADIAERHTHPSYPRLHVLKRHRSKYWYALTVIDGRKPKKSLKTRDLKTALRFAESWYKTQLRASVSKGRQHPLDKLTTNPTIGELFANYRLTLAPHRREYVTIKWGAIGYFWRAVAARDVTPQLIREFYTSRRRRKTHLKTIVTNNTLHKDITLLRQILSYAIEEGHLDQLPIMPQPGKIVARPRPWLPPVDWEHLKAVSTKRIEEAKGNKRLHQQRVDTDDFMRFLVASMCRVDEVRNLRFRDCRVRLTAEGKGDTLIADVTGKRGSRTIIASKEAVEILESRTGDADDLVFPEHHRDAFRELLIAAKLRKDKDGFTRNFKSLRSTAISFAVLAGEDVVWISKNAGTSIAQISDFYVKRLSAGMRVEKSHPVEVPLR